MMKRFFNTNIKLFLLVFVLVLLFISEAALFAEDDPQKSFGLVIPEEVINYWNTHLPDSIEFNSNAFPTALDWSINDSYAKNQLACGACWAFAAVALLENLGAKTDLSEQVVLSCATGNCNGGWYGNALKYIHDFGIPEENCYEYIVSDGTCENKCSQPGYLEFITDYDYYGRWGTPTSNTINDLKNLLQTSPVIVSMLVPADGTFDAYTGGIYNYDGETISSDRGHAVLVVGYNDGEGYFKVKNSWSDNWGESGYFRISYEDVTDDVQFGGYACIGSGAYTSESTPVELSSFSATVQKNQICLDWITQCESNNYGFEVEKSIDGTNFSTNQFIKGFGTTNITQYYSCTDKDLLVGKYYYRLKQIDFDGQFTYSEKIEVYLKAPNNYSLTQNYPNPFNQNTQVYFQLPEYNRVTFKIFNVLGHEIKTLIDKELEAGFHSIIWDGNIQNGSIAPSGIYFYKIKAGSFNKTRRLILTR
jgi:C1A family cysteine protease